MNELIKSFAFKERGSWRSCDDDAATVKFPKDRNLVFTSDSYVVDPIFFPGGDIGYLAVCGTINDLAVMGAKPLGISLSLVIEEGFPQEDLDKIIKSVKTASDAAGTPVVTGDTKVMPRGKLDKIIINTAGVGSAKKEELLTKKPKPGDKIILSGGLGEHAVAILSKRFDYETSLKSDVKALTGEIEAVRSLIKCAKDLTRGGLAAAANEICQRHGVGMELSEEKIPAKKEARKVAEMLGLDILSLACEGKLICVAEKQNADETVKRLRKFNPSAAVIGEITQSGKVVVKTFLGKSVLPTPRGNIVPRIC